MQGFRKPGAMHRSGADIETSLLVHPGSHLDTGAHFRF